MKLLQTKIEYDGYKSLHVEILDSNKVVDKFTLKVKNKGDYLSVRRRIFLVPIPFLFFAYFNRKAIIYNDSMGNLKLSVGDNSMLMILIAAGDKKTTSYTFKAVDK